MSEPEITRDDVRLLFQVLFDMKVLLAEIVKLLGGNDGEEEEEVEP